MKPVTVPVVIGTLLVFLPGLPLEAGPPDSARKRTAHDPQTTASDTEARVVSTSPSAKEDMPTIDVLSGIRNGQIEGAAEGIGDEGIGNEG